MTTCLGKSCSFCLLCVSFLNVYQFVFAFFFPIGFEIRIRDLSELIPDFFLSF